MAMRKELGGLMAENRKLYPLPDNIDGASHGKPGLFANTASFEEKNKILKEKIDSTKVSNAIGRGERSPTADRFG